jgi:hypothetical protein
MEQKINPVNGLILDLYWNKEIILAIDCNKDHKLT